jgi:hypothetical protein
MNKILLNLRRSVADGLTLGDQAMTIEFIGLIDRRTATQVAA